MQPLALAENAPVVSIILATYNGLPFLREAVDSVRAQTFADWELIVIDDGSTDDSVAWLESLRDERVRVLRCEHTGNRGRLRNRGVAAARGRWIAFNDSDDRWRPEKLERQLAYHAARPELGWSYTGRTVIDVHGQPFANPLHRPWVPHSGWILRPLLSFDAAIALPAVLVDRSLLEQAGCFWDHAWGEDYELWIRLAKEAECGLIDEPLVEIRGHASTSAGRPEVPRAYVEVLRRFAAVTQDPVERRIALLEQVRQTARLGRWLIGRRDFRPAFAALFMALRIRPFDLDAWRALVRGVAKYASVTLLGWPKPPPPS